MAKINKLKKLKASKGYQRNKKWTCDDADLPLWFFRGHLLTPKKLRVESGAGTLSYGVFKEANWKFKNYAFNQSFR